MIEVTSCALIRRPVTRCRPPAARQVVYLRRRREYAGCGRAVVSPEVFSFDKGQIGGWRTAFTAEHRRLALERFGDVLRLYGHE